MNEKDPELITEKELCEKLQINRNAAKKLAENANARIKIGRIVRINWNRFKEHYGI